MRLLHIFLLMSFALVISQCKHRSRSSANSQVSEAVSERCVQSGRFFYPLAAKDFADKPVDAVAESYTEKAFMRMNENECTAALKVVNNMICLKYFGEESSQTFWQITDLSSGAPVLKGKRMSLDLCQNSIKEGVSNLSCSFAHSVKEDMYVVTLLNTQTNKSYPLGISLAECREAIKSNKNGRVCVRKAANAAQRETSNWGSFDCINSWRSAFFSLTENYLLFFSISS